LIMPGSRVRVPPFPPHNHCFQIVTSLWRTPPILAAAGFDVPKSDATSWWKPATAASTSSWRLQGPPFDRSADRRRSARDQHVAGRLARQLRAHRSQQQAGPSTPPARPDQDHVRADLLRGGDKLVGGITDQLQRFTLDLPLQQERLGLLEQALLT